MSSVLFESTVNAVPSLKLVLWLWFEVEEELREHPTPHPHPHPRGEMASARETQSLTTWGLLSEGRRVGQAQL